MSSRSFLFTFFNGGGNVPPQLAIARRLVARGHRVRVLTNSPTPAFLERLAAAGCLVTPYEPPADDPSLPPPRGLAFGWTPTVLGMAGLAHRLHTGSPGWADAVYREVQREPVAVVAAERP